MLVGGAAAAALLAGTACAPLPPASAAPVPAAASSDRLVILHNNDLHFSFFHFTRFRALVDSIRRHESDVLLLSGGDIVVRHNAAWPDQAQAFYERRARDMMRMMSEVGYDAAVLGNHELYTHGTATRDILGTAEFPWLAANIQPGEVPLPEFHPYRSFTMPSGLRVLVLGLSIINFDAPGGMVEEQLFETVRSYLPMAREHDVFVLLTHRGIRDDIDLANEFPEIDVIIGGHTHNLLTDGLTVNGVMIAQTGSLGHLPVDAGHVQLGIVTVELAGRSPVRKCARVLAVTGHGVERAGSAHAGAAVTGNPVRRCAA